MENTVDVLSAAPALQTSPAFASAAPSLTKDDVERFGRQMLVEEIGPTHMAEIRRARVACVGAGGLGSTALLYLAAAGVGHLTVVDFDDVEVSNLHRQVIHTQANVGASKAASAKAACQRIFPAADVEAVVAALTPANAIDVLCDCDVVVDGTDNVAARYLINDAAMRCGKPLVSGSAMGWDGQLSVYGHHGGPCYRCIFPQPPPPETVGSCNESGVMGPLPGMIGCLQALETLKVLTGVGETLSGRLFVFNGLRLTSRVVKLRGKQPQCTACSPEALASTAPLTELAGSCRPEYVPSSCAASVTPLNATSSCSVTDFAARLCTAPRPSDKILILDVRVGLQYDMAHLPHSTSLPYHILVKWRREGTLLAALFEVLHAAQRSASSSSCLREATPTGRDGAPVTRGEEEERTKNTPAEVYVMCRRGINSAKAVNLIESTLASAAEEGGAEAEAAQRMRRAFAISNVVGGLNAYHARVDPEFPYY